MARDINLHDLSEEDFEYIRQRPWLVEDAERLGFKIDHVNKTVESPSFPSNTDEDSADEDGVHGQDEDDDYDEWSVEELKHELEARDLKISGNKSELVQRLREDDYNEE